MCGYGRGRGCGSTAGAGRIAGRRWARVRACVRARANAQVDDVRAGRFGTKSASSYAKMVKNAFSWGFHFSAYSVSPDKSFWCGKKSS